MSSPRALDTFAMLNPALAASVLASAAASHRTTVGGPMPLALAFLVVPLALHAPFRRALPGNTRARLAGWLADNPEVRAQFPEIASSYVSVTRRGLRAGLRTGGLTLDGNALRGRLERADLDITDEVTECLGRARLAGRWLWLAGNPAVTYRLLGVRP
jgi:Family of unknown function (DUF6521)